MSQDRQKFIFSRHFFWAVPSQIVPLINQQRSPALNSQAGHCLFFSEGQFFITQHGLLFSKLSFTLDTRKNTCRSTWDGIDRHPCS